MMHSADSQDLKKQAAPWFVVLRVLSGELDVGKGSSGKFRKIANAWIIWGKERGYI